MLQEPSVIQMKHFQQYHPKHENLTIYSAESQAMPNSVLTYQVWDNSDLNASGNPLWHMQEILKKHCNANTKRDTWMVEINVSNGL